MWEIGILLVGIGFLFFSVYLGVLLKHTADTVKRVNTMLDRNSREIEDIIRNASRLLETADTMTQDISGITSGISFGLSKLGLASTVAKTAMSVAQRRRKRNDRRA